MDWSYTPELIASTRSIGARAILENRVDLRSYPHRYLAVVPSTGSSISTQGMAMQEILAAVEVLDRFGWDLVTMPMSAATQHHLVLYAVLRRRQPPANHPQ